MMIVLTNVELAFVVGGAQMDGAQMDGAQMDRSGFCL